MKTFSSLTLLFFLLTACQTSTPKSFQRQFHYRNLHHGHEIHYHIVLEIEPKGEVTAKIYYQPNTKNYDIYFIGLQKNNLIEGLEHQSMGDKVIKTQNTWELGSHTLTRNNLIYQEF